ncbi:MAG TPA: PAS domain S-box protein [Ginsengibacter sp.]
MSITKPSPLIKRVASFITIIAGCVVLAGWFFNIPSLRSLIPGYGAMEMDAAFCFVLCGIALYLLADGPLGTSFRKYVAFACTFIVLAISLSSLLHYVFGWDISANKLFWNLIHPGSDGSDAGTMSLLVSLNFTLLCFSFLLLGKRNYHLLVQVLLIALIPGSLLVIFNHLFGVSFLTAIPLRAPTSMMAALLFIILCIGVFISPALGYIHYSFVKKIAVFFILTLLVRATVFFAIDRNNQLAADKDKWMSHNHKVLVLTESLNDQSNEIQSNVRGYIITGDEKIPLILNQKTDSIKNIIAHLRTIVKENTAQRSMVDTLDTYLTSFITSQNELLSIRRDQGFEAAKKLIIISPGTALLNKIHSLAPFIEQRENQILTIHKAQNELIVRNSSRLFAVFQFIAAILLLVAFKMIYDHVRLRNKTEQALKKSLKETSDYKYALNESAIVSITDEKGIIKHVNDNFCKISRHTRGELLGQDHKIVNSGYHTKEFMRELWQTLQEGKVWRGELKNKAKDGSLYWVDTIIVPFLSETGKPYQYLALRSDITPRKELGEEIIKMNQELQKTVEKKTREVIEKEQQYRFLFQNMREGIQIIGSDWKYLFVNSSAVEHCRYPQEELLGYTMMEKYPGIEKTELFSVIQNCMKNRCADDLEYEFKFPGGDRRWFKMSIQPVAGGISILSIDIEERKKVEEQLLESERFLNKTQEVSKIGSYILDFNSRAWKGSRELDNIFGLMQNDEHNIDRWISIIHPEDRAMMTEYLIAEVIGKKQRFDKEYKIINKETKKVLCVHGIGDLQFEADGTLVKMIGTIQDITERKQLEKEIAEQKLKEQKLINEIIIQTQEKERKELGRELHDNVNQILAIVKMYLGMLNTGDYSTEDNLLEKSYEYVNDAMQEIRKLSHSLVAPSLGNLGLKESLQILSNDANLLNGIKVHLDIDKKFNDGEIDKTKELMLYRVVQEQLNNITKYAKANEAFITLKKEGSILFLTIADNGVGFDTNQKSTGGIGLTNMKSRIEFYSGKLNIISAPQQGCKIEISIPSA